MQNRILHPAQHTRRTAQVSKRIGTRYTAGTPSFSRFLGTIEVLSLSYPAENGTIRCRIKFCIQHNTLEDQHKLVSESGANFPYVLFRRYPAITLVNSLNKHDIEKMRWSSIELLKKVLLRQVNVTTNPAHFVITTYIRSEWIIDLSEQYFS